MPTANQLAAYLYLRLGDQMPTPIINDQGEVDHEADNAAIKAWSAGSDDFSIDVHRLDRFLVDLESMLVDLSNETDPDQYMVHFYDAAKATFDHDKTQIRTWFGWLYMIIFERAEGPRWGDFVSVYGPTEFVDLVRRRLETIA